MFIKKIAPIAALLTGLGVAHVLANDIEPTKEKYTSPFTLTPIVLDGSLSEWGGVGQIVDPKVAVPKGSGGTANANYVLFEEYAGGTWTGPDDQTSAVQGSYVAASVYFVFVATGDYQPPVELLRFITPFGVRHFNDQVTVRGIAWEDSAVYRAYVT